MVGEVFSMVTKVSAFQHFFIVVKGESKPTFSFKENTKDRDTCEVDSIFGLILTAIFEKDKRDLESKADYAGN